MTVRAWISADIVEHIEDGGRGLSSFWSFTKQWAVPKLLIPLGPSSNPSVHSRQQLAPAVRLRHTQSCDLRSHRAHPVSHTTIRLGLDVHGRPVSCTCWGKAVPVESLYDDDFVKTWDLPFMYKVRRACWCKHDRSCLYTTMPAFRFFGAIAATTTVRASHTIVQELSLQKV